MTKRRHDTDGARDADDHDADRRDAVDDEGDAVGGQPREHAMEAEWRWGNTDAWAQSKRRTSRYTKDDWRRMQEEGGRILQAAVAAMRAGRPADGVDAKAVAELHRLHITQWFYDCDPQMHATLAEGYVADERFAATFESFAPGLAAWFSRAVIANAHDRGARADVEDALAALKQSMGLRAPGEGPLAGGPTTNDATRARPTDAQVERGAGRRARRRDRSG